MWLVRTEWLDQQYKLFKSKKFKMIDCQRNELDLTNQKKATLFIKKT